MRITTPRIIRTLALITISGATLSAAALGGCSSSTNATRERTRTISQEDALADFDRAWEIVHETHFDTTFNGVDWAAVRDELRPRAAQAYTRGELRRVMQEMLDRLGQSHFGIIPASAAEPRVASSPSNESGSGDTNELKAPSKVDAVAPGASSDAGLDGEGDADTGIELRVLEDLAVVSAVREGSPAQSAGVKTGWILEQIRSRDVGEMLAQLHEALGEEEMGIHAVGLLSGRLQGPEGSSVPLTFLDGADERVELEIEREPMPGEFVKFGNLPPMSTHLSWSRETATAPGGREVQIGVIKFNIWMIPIAPKFERAMYELRDCEGLIIDLRGNPGGVGALSSSLGRFLVSKKSSLGTMKMRGAELSFNIEPVIVTTWGERIEPFKGPIAILQDSGSASTSEVFAGGLQSLKRVQVFGTRSAGMALPAGMDKLPSGDVLLHAIADFVTSTGARMEHGGVVPDVEVRLTRENLLGGIDSPKHAAKNWIARAGGVQ